MDLPFPRRGRRVEMCHYNLAYGLLPDICRRALSGRIFFFILLIDHLGTHTQF